MFARVPSRVNVALWALGAKEGNVREIKDGMDIVLPDQKELAIPLMLPPPINDQLVEVREAVGLIVKDCIPGVVVVEAQFQSTPKPGMDVGVQPAGQLGEVGGPGGPELGKNWPGIEVTVAAGTLPVVFVVGRSAEFIPLAFSLKDKAGLLTGIAVLGL